MSRNADSMSVFAKKKPGPKRLIPCIVTYWRLKSSFYIEALMLVELDFGKER